MSKGVSKMFDGLALNPFAAQPGVSAGADDEDEMTFELEMGGPPTKLQGSRAERR